jgi:hypothetical protein
VRISSYLGVPKLLNLLSFILSPILLLRTPLLTEWCKPRTEWKLLKPNQGGGKPSFIHLTQNATTKLPSNDSQPGPQIIANPPLRDPPQPKLPKTPPTLLSLNRHPNNHHQPYLNPKLISSHLVSYFHVHSLNYHVAHLPMCNPYSYPIPQGKNSTQILPQFSSCHDARVTTHKRN